MEANAHDALEAGGSGLAEKPYDEREADSSLQKYRALYDLARECHAEEVQRSFLMTQKGTWYLAVLSFLLGIVTMEVRWVFSNMLPPRGLAEWICMVSVPAMAILLIVAWLSAFRMLRNEGLKKLPFDDSVISFFEEQRPVDVYFALAKTYRDGYEHNRAATDSRARIIGRVYPLVRWALVPFVLFAIASAWYVWTQPREGEKGRFPMTNEEQGASDSVSSKDESGSGQTGQTDQGGKAPAPTTPGKPNPATVAPKMQLIEHAASDVDVRKLIIEAPRPKVAEHGEKPDAGQDRK